MFARLYSVKYIPVAIAVHLSLLLCVYHLWYSSGSIDSTHQLRNPGSNFDVDEVWLRPYNALTETSQHQTESITHWKPASHTLRKIPNITSFTHWQFIAINSKRSHVEGYETQHITWHEARRWKQPDHPSLNRVVLFEHCARTDDVVTFSNIYAYHDSIASCAAQLARSFPAAILVFIVPETLATLQHNAPHHGHHERDSLLELELLHSHLSHNYLVHQKGLLVAGTRQAMQARSDLGGESSHTRTLRYLDLQISQIASSIAPTSFPSTANQAKSPFVHLVEFQRSKLFAAAPSLHSQCAKHYFTRKYDPQCHPPSALTHPFLVTGLGGAGTHYAARQLRQQGWQVLHENLDSDGAVSWIYAANDWSIQMDYPYGALPPGESSFLTPRFRYVIHLVRSPLDQISSFTAHSNKSYNFVLRTMEGFLLSQHPAGRGNETVGLVERFQKSRTDQHDCHRGGNCHLEFAALSWLHWNRFVHSFADATFRVDQVHALQEHVCQLASTALYNNSLPLSPLMKRRRYCEIKDCPSMNEDTSLSSLSHAMEKLGFHLIDRAFGVCALNEVLFRRSAVHKRHRKYRWGDIADVDPHIVREIQADAVKYGFKIDF